MPAIDEVGLLSLEIDLVTARVKALIEADFKSVSIRQHKGKLVALRDRVDDLIKIAGSD